MSLDLQRQSGLIPTDKISELDLTIIGAGAIGSHVAECLGKIGIRELEVWDFDSVETHNLPNQGYRLSDLGKMKATALKQRLEEDIGLSVLAKTERLEAGVLFTNPIVISAVDSMASRKVVWDNVQKSLGVYLFIDGRMAAMYGEIYAVDMSDSESQASYAKTLFSDSEVLPEPCTEKATIFCAQGMAAWITSIVADYVTDGAVNEKKLSVDFVRKVVGSR